MFPELYVTWDKAFWESWEHSRKGGHELKRFAVWCGPGTMGIGGVGDVSGLGVER